MLLEPLANCAGLSRIGTIRVQPCEIVGYATPLVVDDSGPVLQIAKLVAPRENRDGVCCPAESVFREKASAHGREDADGRDDGG